MQVSTLLLAPLCPHTCHHIWSNVLRRPGSVLTAGWPLAPPPDATLLRMAAYVERIKDRLGSTIAKETQPKKAKKGAATAGPPPKVLLV